MSNKKPTKLQSERDHFTRANSFIRSSREDRFMKIHQSLTAKLRQAPKNNETLRKVAREMVEAGYYSPKGSINQVEHMLVVKLFRLSGLDQGKRSWQKFVKEVAPDWSKKW